MKTINKYVLLLIMLLQINFFDLFPIMKIFSKVNSYSSKYLIVFIISICFFANILLTYSHSNRDKFTMPIIYNLVMVVIVLFCSMYVYEQSFLTTFKCAYYFIILLFYFLLVRFNSLDKNFFDFFVKLVIYIGTIYAVLYIFQSITLYFGGIKFLQITSSIDVASIASGQSYITGFQRLQAPSDFISVSLLTGVVATRFINLKHINLFLIADLMYLLCVSQTRIYMVAGIVVYSIYVLSSSNMIKKFAFMAILLITFLALIFHSSVFDMQTRAGSSQVRLMALPYYLSKINLHGMFGIGFASDNLFFNLNHGYTTFDVMHPGAYYLDDMGIVGFISVFGYIGVSIIFFYVVALFRSISVKSNGVAGVLIISFLIISNVTVSIFDPQRILYLPILLFLLYATSKKGEEVSL